MSFETYLDRAIERGDAVVDGDKIVMDKLGWLTEPPPNTPAGRFAAGFFIALMETLPSC